MRFSLLQLMLLSAALALGLGLHLSSQRAQDYWLDRWYFEPQSVSFSPDGKLLAISFPSGEIAIVEITPHGFRSLPCAARWAAPTGLGHPRFVTEDQLLYYQARPSDVRQPGIAKWDVRSNRATAGSPFSYATPGVPLERCYVEKSGVGVLLEPQRLRFIVAPDRAAGHRHLTPPEIAVVENWDLTTDGKQLVVIGFLPNGRNLPSRRIGQVIDIQSGEVLHRFPVRATLQSPMTMRPNHDEVAVFQMRNAHQFEVALRRKKDWSALQSVPCDILDPGRAWPIPLRFSHSGNRIAVDNGLGKVQILDIETRRAIETVEVARPLLASHPRATGYILSAARTTHPERCALSPDGKAFAIVQDMHVELWEADSDRYLGRAWTAWNPWGPIRRHIGLLVSFGVMTGLIWRWQRKRATTHVLSTRGWRIWTAITRLFLLGLGAVLIVRLVPPLFLPTKESSREPSLLLVYGLLFTSVLAIALAIGCPSLRSQSRSPHAPREASGSG
jgi:hypothetical protein